MFRRIQGWPLKKIDGTITFGDIGAANKGVYPGFLFLRHLLATVILLHHARILTNGPHDGSTGTVIGAGLATMSDLFASKEMLRPFLYSLVGAFFALSGFLVAGSAMRNRSLKDFLLLRIFRLLPALMMEITLSALILGPLVTTMSLGAYFTDFNFFQYFGNLVGFVQFDLPGVFTHNPFPDRVNESLWTLDSELACYVIIALVMATGLLFNRRWFAITFLAVTTVLVIALSSHVVDLDTRMDLTRFSRWFIVYLFFAGAMFKFFEDMIPASATLFVLCVVAYYVLVMTGVFDIGAGLCLVYATIYVGSRRFDWFDRYCRWDLSYGLYLYGFPISQALIFFLVPNYLPHGTKGVMIVCALSLTLAVIFASASWILVEKPALRLKKMFVHAPAIKYREFVAAQKSGIEAAAADAPSV